MKILLATLIFAPSVFAASIEGTWNLTGFACSSGKTPNMTKLPDIKSATLTINANDVSFSADAMDCLVAGIGTYTLSGSTFTPDFPTVDVTCDGSVQSIGLGAVQTEAAVTDAELQLAVRTSEVRACPRADAFILIFERL